MKHSNRIQQIST